VNTRRLVDLAYGRGVLPVALQGASPVVVTPRHTPAAPDPIATVAAAIAAPVAGPPLRELVRQPGSIAISVCDVTRAQPRQAMLTALLAIIDEVRPGADVTVLIATGTHRPSTPEEELEMLGRAVLDRVRVVNHDARDQDSLVYLGVHGDDVPVYVNRLWHDADLRITTGFVEPHFFAGFSGGPKMVVPGLAGLATTMILHDARRIGDPRSTWGNTEDNPVHRDIRACAQACPPAFSVDVLLNPDKKVTHAFAGELFSMYRAACATAREQAMQAVQHRFDVVVTTGSGYPLDQNLYQAVKGLAAAERVVRPGGTIVVAAECADGLPDHGSFAEVLGSAPSPEALLEMINSPGFAIPDQWQVQILARVLTQATVQIFTAGLDHETARRSHVEPIDDVEAAVAAALDRYGPEASVCYLPDGPQTIPFLVPSP
jgi:nickel-dependent lactate racemase